MSLRRTFFLDQFDSDFKTHVIEFSKKISEISSQYDVLIFLARKAACLADCLEELDLSSFDCVITSSRTLDMNLNWLQGKRVAIIDDALISGTSIYEARQKLENAQALTVDVYVLSVDTNWWSSELIQPKEPFLKLDPEQTSRICANIVDAISVVPRPYSIDYPLFKKIRIKEEDFPELSNSSNWAVYESTSSHQEKYNVLNLTIRLSDASTLKFLDQVGLPWDENFLIKIRLYALKIEDVYWCEVLPLVVLPPMNQKDVNLLFKSIVPQTELTEINDWFSSGSNDDELKAKLRFIQYFLGCKLVYFWEADITNKLGANITLEQDFRNLNFLFPPPISERIKNISNEVPRCEGIINFSFAPKKQINPTKTEGSEDENVLLFRLTQKFMELYQNKELKARELVKTYGRNVFVIEEYKQIVNRLKQGYSFADLKESISSEASDIHPGKLVSLFLDIYIDRGAVVPITYIKDDLIYRAYRHGEDVEFAENEINLCVSMLEKLAKEYGSLQLPPIVVEKALVLFLRVGIQANFLRLSSYPMGEYKTMGIRFHLHGAIVGKFDKSIYKVNYGDSLTNILTEAGYLKRKKPQEPYTIVSTANKGMSLEGQHKANQLGLVLGNLLKPKKTNKLTTKELTLMATCTYPMDVVGALAAEVNIFMMFYSYNEKTFFPQFEKVKYTEYAKIRIHKAYTALNSGSWKYDCFKKKLPWKIIKRANDVFDNELYTEVWKSFWPNTGEQSNDPTANPAIVNLADRLADFLLAARFYINLIEATLLPGRSAFMDGKGNEALLDILKLFEKYRPNQIGYFSNIYKQTIGKLQISALDKPRLYQFCKDKLQQNFNLGRQLLTEVDSLANNFGKIEKSYTYDHVVVVDFKAFDQPYSQIHKAYEEVLNKAQNDAKFAGAKIVEIGKSSTPIQTGTWLCSEGKNSRRWLLQFYRNLAERLQHHAHLKFTFFFHLDSSFKIRRRSTSNEFQAPVFWDMAKELLKKKFRLHTGNEAIYFTQSGTNITAIESEMQNQLKDFIAIHDRKKEYTIKEPYSALFFSNHYRSTKVNQVRSIMDVGILTIVPEEIAAVTDFFKSNNTYGFQRGTQTARKFHFGKLEVEGDAIKCVALQANEQGNRSIIPAYNALVEEFNPSLIVLLGIAGSISKAKLDDVVIADATYYYDKRAVTEEGTQHRIDPFKINSWTRELLNNFFHEFKTDEPNFQAEKDSYQNTFTTYCGPLGTGEAVVKYREAEEKKWLLKVNDKVLALETEAGGFTTQFYEDELSYSRRVNSILILRGISDHADQAKDDKWRLPAAKNAMKVLVEFLKINSDEILQPPFERSQKIEQA